MNDLASVINLSEFETLARPLLAESAYAYIAGGAGDEESLAENIAAFKRYRLRPRVLVDVSSLDLSTTLLGSGVGMPVGLAPVALQALAHPEAESAAARAAGAAGVVFCLSTLSNHSVETVAAAGPATRWFQLYVHKDRSVSEELIRRAERAGYQAVVATVDLPVAGYRERELRTKPEVPEGGFGSFADGAGGANFSEVLVRLQDQSLNWSDLEWIRAASELPLVLKGILTAEDARLAVEHGAQGIVVSNHGGRQLDRSPAPIDVLEEVVGEVDGRVEVYLDGGVRRGTDVCIALALGARAVFIGRPYIYALAAGGEAGVARALEIVKSEIENAMALLGVRSVSEITRAYVA